MFPAEKDGPLGLVCLLAVEGVCFSLVLLRSVRREQLCSGAAALTKPILSLSVISLGKSQALFRDASLSQNQMKLDSLHLKFG